MDYFQKYLKYKAKYIMLGGVNPPITFGLTFDELYEKMDCIYHLVHVEYSPTSENPVFGDKLEIYKRKSIKDIDKIKSKNKIIDFFNKKKLLHRIQNDKTEKGFKTYYFILGYCLYIHTITLYKKQALIDLLKTEEIQMGSPINYIVYNFDYTKNQNRFRTKKYSLIITLTEKDLIFKYNNSSEKIPEYDDYYYSITMVDGIKTLNKCIILVDKYNILSCIEAKSILERFYKYDRLFEKNNKDEKLIISKNPKQCNFHILNLKNFKNCEIKET